MLFRFKWVLLILVFTMSCTNKQPRQVKDKFTNVRVLSVMSCASKFTEYITLFSEGKLADDKVDEFWGCNTDLVSIFLERSKVDSNDPSYQPLELASFINKLQSDHHIDEETVLKFFKLKKVLIGGMAGSIEKSELVTLLSKIDTFKSFTKNIKNELPVLLEYFKKPTSVDYINLQQAWSVLIPQAKKLVKDADFNKINFAGLKEILNVFMNNETSQSVTEVVQTYTEITMGLNKDINDEAVFDNYLRLAEFLSFSLGHWKSWLNGEQNEHLVSMLKDFVSDLSKSIDERKKTNQGPVIESAEWELLFSGIAKLAKLENLESNSIKKAWLYFSENVFAAKAGNFSSQQVEYVNAGLKSFLTSINEYDVIKNSSQNCVLTDGNQINSQSINLYFSKCFSAYFYLDKKAKINLGKDKKEILNKQTYLSLNIKRAILSLFIESSSDDLYIDSDDLSSFFTEMSDLLNLFIEIEPGVVESFQDRIAVEADLFTPYSVGDGRLSVFELTSYFTMLISSFEMQSEFNNTVNCDSAKSLSSCFFNSLATTDVIGNFAQMKLYIENLNEDQSNIYFEKVKSVFIDEDQDLTSFDILKVLMLTHYQEVFFASVDEGRNSVLEYPEVAASFARNKKLFIDLLSNIFDEIDEEKAQGIYTYLISKGGLAGMSDDEDISKVNEELRYLNWLYYPGKRVSQAERLELISALQFLTQFL